MSSKYPENHLEKTIQNLERLKGAAEAGKVTLRHRWPLGFVDQPDDIEAASTSEVILESLSQIVDERIRYAVIFEKLLTREVEFGILDEQLDTCYVISSADLVELMTATNGADGNERASLETLNRTINTLLH